jgi:hypothetical protein
MKKVVRFVMGLCVGVTFIGMAAAQESQGGAAIPKILQITREWTKPGKSGVAHEKAEAAFVQAMSRSKWPTHYLAMTSLSGKSRALFLTRYDSYEAWEKDTAAVEKNASLTAALDHAYAADGEMLDGLDQGVFEFNEEMSLRPRGDLSHMRYMEISSYHVRPGHLQEWRELVKMVKAGYEKGVADAHWGVFEERFGGDGGTYLVLHAHTSIADLDKSGEEDKQFAAAMGEQGMKKFGELFGSAVDTSQHQLFAFNPHMSYIYEEWAKADPDFWRPKTTPTTTKAVPEEKKKTGD